MSEMRNTNGQLALPELRVPRIQDQNDNQAKHKE